MNNNPGGWNKEHPKSCPISGAEPGVSFDKFHQFACGSRFNFEHVVMTYASQRCIENKLDDPATEYLFQNRDAAARGVGKIRADDC